MNGKFNWSTETIVPGPTMKTEQGFRPNGNFVVALPQAGVSKMIKKAARSILFIIQPPTTPGYMESVSPPGVRLHLSLVPGVQGPSWGLNPII